MRVIVRRSRALARLEDQRTPVGGLSRAGAAEARPSQTRLSMMAGQSDTTRPLSLVRALELAGEEREAGRDAAADALLDHVAQTDPPPRSLRNRLVGRFARPAVEALAQQPRILKYRVLSTCPRVSGKPIVLQPVLFVGPGEVVLGDGVQFGWKNSPLFYTGYCHVEVSRPRARIEVGDRTEFNNNLMLKSEGAGIRVGRDGLFGAHIEIFDSNFHDLDPRRRRESTQAMAPVEIGDNVFVGMSAKILKGVTIGSDSVIGAGAVVASSIPSGVIAAGNPARVIREL
jgi:acetyltransferase-like isoleucine patch superfamily enzyme